jgi:hypothetical protein
MSLLRWFDTREATAFGGELARFILTQLGGRLEARDEKFKTKAAKTLVQAGRRLDEFKSSHALNFYTKGRLANAFLWALKDGGCPAAYADELTGWLTRSL